MSETKPAGVTSCTIRLTTYDGQQIDAFVTRPVSNVRAMNRYVRGATAVAGIPEVVADRQSGWLVPPGDAVALAAALTVLLWCVSSWWSPRNVKSRLLPVPRCVRAHSTTSTSTSRRARCGSRRRSPG